MALTKADRLPHCKHPTAAAAIAASAAAAHRLAALSFCLLSGCQRTLAHSQSNPAPNLQDGFIHLSADPSLLLTIANHFYTDSLGDWLVLVLDPARLSAEASNI